MTDLQFMPFYWGDFLGDTSHLTGLESGVYALLLGNMWMRHGWVPDDDAEIARMCRIDLKTWRMMRAKIDPLLRHKEGRISQKRLLDEIRKAKRIAAKNRKRAANFAAHNEKKQKGKMQSDQTDMPLSEGYARVRTATATATATRFPNGNHNPPTPPKGGTPRAKKRDFNDVFNEMQGKGDSDDNGYFTIDASIERRDSGRTADIVQFHAISKDDGS